MDAKLRELGRLPQNKFCAECDERGPMYVDTTAGTFVCSDCSGILRGLQPAHRVKNLSAASFTADEVTFIEQTGNKRSKEFYLANWCETDTRPSPKDRDAFRLFLKSKYERRKWASNIEPVQKILGHDVPTLVVSKNAEAPASPGARRAPAPASAHAPASPRMARPAQAPAAVPAHVVSQAPASSYVSNAPSAAGLASFAKSSPTPYSADNFYGPSSSDAHKPAISIRAAPVAAADDSALRAVNFTLIGGKTPFGHAAAAPLPAPAPAPAPAVAAAPVHATAAAPPPTASLADDLFSLSVSSAKPAQPAPAAAQDLFGLSANASSGVPDFFASAPSSSAPAPAALDFFSSAPPTAAPPTAAPTLDLFGALPARPAATSAVPLDLFAAPRAAPPAAGPAADLLSLAPGPQAPTPAYHPPSAGFGMPAFAPQPGPGGFYSPSAQQPQAFPGQQPFPQGYAHQPGPQHGYPQPAQQAPQQYYSHPAPQQYQPAFASHPYPAFHPQAHPASAFAPQHPSPFAPAPMASASVPAHYQSQQQQPSLI
eukprot:m.232227 g.232227  ORF g.232227 m.232227 type:complete len:541 (+) comp12319_c0_seq1:61-1683(+)